MSPGSDDAYGGEPRSKFVSFVPEMGYPVFEREETPDRTQVTSEIAARLLELRENDPTAPILLMTKLLRLYRIDPFSMWLAVEVLASDQLAGKSLAKLGQEEKETKQATHQRQNRALHAIEKTMPEIALALRSILSRQSSAGISPEEPT